jgi:hypothetical protein
MINVVTLFSRRSLAESLGGRNPEASRQKSPARTVASRAHGGRNAKSPVLPHAKMLSPGGQAPDAVAAQRDGGRLIENG